MDVYGCMLHGHWGVVKRVHTSLVGGSDGDQWDAALCMLLNSKQLTRTHTHTTHTYTPAHDKYAANLTPHRHHVSGWFCNVHIANNIISNTLQRTAQHQTTYRTWAHRTARPRFKGTMFKHVPRLCRWHQTCKPKHQCSCSLSLQSCLLDLRWLTDLGLHELQWRLVFGVTLRGCTSSPRLELACTAAPAHAWTGR